MRPQWAAQPRPVPAWKIKITRCAAEVLALQRHFAMIYAFGKFCFLSEIRQDSKSEKEKTSNRPISGISLAVPKATLLLPSKTARGTLNMGILMLSI